MMVVEMKSEELDRKLKRQAVEACLNCKKFVRCESIGRFAECENFAEVEDEAWVIRKI